MKKIFFGMMALVAMVATSCQQDVDLDQQVNLGETATVSFNLATPQIATKAKFSEGALATHLQYAVYDANQDILNGFTVTDGTINGSTTVEFQLTTGNTYYVLFWAAAPGAPYTVNLAAKTMEVSYDNAVSSAENRDAFYYYDDFTVEAGMAPISAELKRPFAQLNIGTNDLAQSESAGHKVTHAMVEVAAYSTLNLADGEVGGKAVRTFAYTAIPGSSQVFPVNDTEYDYLAMNYLLMGTTKETVDVKFTYATDATGANAKTRTVGSVPVQRNHRTNLYGQLLTSNTKVNVEIKPEYDDPMYEADELHKAAILGGTVTLTEDVVLDSPLKVSSNLTINLNGKTLSAALAKGDGAVVEIAEGIKTEIVGGTIKNTTENGGAAIRNNGELVLSGVKIEGAPIGTTGYPDYAVYSVGGSVVVEEGTEIVSDRGAINMQGGADVTINGGEFAVTDAVGSRVLTAHVIYAYGSSSKLTINGGDFAQNIANGGGTSVICPAGATIKIYGGNFYHVPVADFQSKVFHNYMGYGAPVDVYGGTYNDDSVTKSGNLADGYKAVLSNGKYYVVADTVDAVVADATELQAALAAGGEVVLTGDVTYSESITNDAVINLNGNSFLPASTITLNNNADLTMVGGDYVVNGTYGHVDVRPSTADGSTVVYENVNFAYNKLEKTYGPSTNRLGSVVEVCPTATDAKTVIKFKNCTFDNAMVLIEGMSGKTGIVEAVFEGCTFNALTSSAPIQVINYVTATIEVKNCTFNLECTSSVASAISVSPSSSTSVVLTATNNTLNAVAATPYTYDASKGETEAHNVKVNGTPANIKFISAYDNTTVTETGTVKSGIAL